MPKAVQTQPRWHVVQEAELFQDDARVTSSDLRLYVTDKQLKTSSLSDWSSSNSAGAGHFPTCRAPKIQSKPQWLGPGGSQLVQGLIQHREPQPLCSRALLSLTVPQGSRGGYFYFKTKWK